MHGCTSSTTSRPTYPLRPCSPSLCILFPYELSQGLPTVNVEIGHKKNERERQQATLDPRRSTGHKRGYLWGLHPSPYLPSHLPSAHMPSNFHNRTFHLHIVHFLLPRPFFWRSLLYPHRHVRLPFLGRLSFIFTLGTALTS